MGAVQRSDGIAFKCDHCKVERRVRDDSAFFFVCGFFGPAGRPGSLARLEVCGPACLALATSKLTTDGVRKEWWPAAITYGPLVMKGTIAPPAPEPERLVLVDERPSEEDVRAEVERQRAAGVVTPMIHGGMRVTKLGTLDASFNLPLPGHPPPATPEVRAELAAEVNPPHAPRPAGFEHRICPLGATGQCSDECNAKEGRP